ncbi:amidohydrolase [Symbiobacterium terraclitae]|uniref:amidohydrolase n=1 Tax=Symbiobacterium terraclitae TaxID=557451 RepID=UPI0035B529DA
MRAISNARILTVADGVIESGTVLVDDQGRIAAVGARVAVPDGVEIIDAGGRTLTPGLVDAFSHLGLINEGLGWAGNDAEETTDPNTAHVRALDGIYPFDRGIAEARSGGVTTVHVVPRGGNVLAGEALAVKLRRAVAADDLVLRRPTGIAASLGERPKATHGSEKRMPATRMGVAAVLREALVKAQEYRPEKGRDLRCEALLPVLRGELTLLVQAHRADDIATALRIGREFGIRITLLGATEAFLVADLIAEAGATVAAGPSLAARGRQETREVGFHLPLALHRQGVPTAIVTGHPELPEPYLNIAAALAVREGLTPEEALRAVTLTPAQILGVADRVGAIAPGLDADLVLWDDDPLELTTRVAWTMVEGRIVYRDGSADGPYGEVEC